MDLFEVLEKRYSCRNYINKSINDEDIAKIINYASFAPSAGNLQQWQVIVVKNKEKRESLAIASLNQSWMKDAPIHLVILGNEEYVKKFYKVKGELYCKQDCAAFIENILLIATSLGIGSCWVGAFDNEMVKRELEIPDNLIPYSIITLGYSKEKNPNNKQRYRLWSFTFFDKYGNRSKDDSLIPMEKYIPEIKEKSKNIFSEIKNKLIKHSK
jgi:nitroreductase